MAKVVNEIIEKEENPTVYLYDDTTCTPLVAISCKDKPTANNLAELINKLEKNGDITSISEPIYY